jgi:acyl carrier protein
MSEQQPVTNLGRPQITETILSGLEDALAMSDGDTPAPAELGEETRLIGRKGVLDSMGLVTLIVDVEQRLEEQYDVVVVLADERAMSQERSPFRSVSSLADYISQLVEEQT